MVVKIYLYGQLAREKVKIVAYRPNGENNSEHD